MSFFDKKEEVIDIQLTTYGKELLSKGDFKPFYYAFYDEGILYDALYGGITEDQNDAQYRIKNETIYNKDNADYLSAKEIAHLKELVPNNFSNFNIPLFDFNITYDNQLVTSANNKENAPAWKISMLQSALTSSATVLTSSANSRVIQIPQVNVDNSSIEYKTSIIEDIKVLDEDGQETLLTNLDKCESEAILDNNSFLFPDGTRLLTEENNIIIKIEEDNSLNLIDNFEFEIFEILEVTGSIKAQSDKQVLRPLKFFKFKPQVKNGILMSSEDNFQDIQNLEKIDNSFVSNYFEVLVDGDVDQAIVCKAEGKTKGDTLFVKDPIDCKALETARAGIYDAELGDGDIAGFVESLGEDCE